MLSRALPCLRRIVTPALQRHQSAGAAAPHIEKIVDDIAKLNLLEVSEFVKLLKVRLDIPDMMTSMPMSVAAPAGEAAEAPVVAEKTIFTVKLAGFDAVNKVKTIKEVRAITKLGLKEAKALVESAPCDIVKDVNKKDAEAILEQLKAAGANAELI